MYISEAVEHMLKETIYVHIERKKGNDFSALDFTVWEDFTVL